jgi:hypothetical protein
MKRSVSPVHQFKLTFVGLLLAGLCWLMPSHLQAQSSSTASVSFYEAPAGPYTTPAIAITRVENQIASIKSQLANVVHGSQEFTNLTVKEQFYSIIDDQLLAGKTVKESLELGLKLFTTDVASGLSKGKKEEYKQEALNLLKP